MLSRIAALPVSTRVARPHWLAAGVLAVWGAFWFATSSDDTDAAAVILPLLLLALLAGAALDDPAAVTLESSPTPLLARRLLRVTPAVALLAFGWTVVLVLASQRIEVGTVRSGAYTLEFAALTTVGLACGGAGTRRPPTGNAAVGGAAGVLVFAMVSQTIAYRWHQVPSLLPTTPHHNRWWIVLVVAAAVFLASSRDPAARAPRYFRQGGPPAKTRRQRRLLRSARGVFEANGAVGRCGSHGHQRDGRAAFTVAPNRPARSKRLAALCRRGGSHG